MMYRHLLLNTFCLFLFVVPIAHAKVNVDISITGVSENIRSLLLTSLSIVKQKDNPLANNALIRRLHEKSPVEIKNALQSFGYYQPEISSKLDEHGSDIDVQYTINTGKPLRIATLEIIVTGEGRSNPALLNFTNHIALKSGNIFINSDYEDAKQALQEYAFEIGYLDAAFTRRTVTIDLDQYRSDIILELNSGPQFYFGALNFHQDILTPDLLYDFAPFSLGEPYKITKLLQLQKALSDSGYFQYVQVEPQRDRAIDTLIPVDVKLTPLKRNKYSAGIGFSTDTGPRASLGWENRRINRAGHRLGADYSVDQTKDTETLRYLIPIHFYTADQIAVTANRVHEYDAGRNNTANSLSLARSYGRDLWRNIVSIDLLLDENKTEFGIDRTRLLMPSLVFTRLDADDRLYATKGNRENITLHFAHGALFSDLTFLQLAIESKWVQKVTGKDRLIASAEFGASHVAQDEALPGSLRFFAGGDRNVRGYGYKTIGPADGNGDIVGGNHKMLSSLEIEHDVLRNWSGALFFDVGNAFDHAADALPLKRGAGFGLRWRSPLGLIRLDIARALDREGMPWRAHLIIGPDL